jgi:CubicO group peptidase (beta-lactamase class C family)
MLNSTNTFGGFGAGSNGLWVDPVHQLSFSFLSTGLLEDSYHMERTALLCDLVMSALVN